MGLYLYCIGGLDHPAPEAVSGVGGAAVERIEAGGFAAWVSTMEAAPAPSLEGARAHNEVVQRACSERTALPLRFGQWFPDLPALESLLLERRDALTAGLRRVEGRMEMGIRVIDPSLSDEPPDRSSGRAYLETLGRREARARAARERGESLAAELEEWLRPVVGGWRTRAMGTAAGLVSVSCLVARHDIGDYNHRARMFPERHPDLRFLFSGPWPPYGFANDGRQDAA